MTTTQKDIKATPLVPEVLTEEHHEALTRSWEMPAYDRASLPARKSDRSLVAGILAGVVGLALGFGAGYLVRGGTVETAEPFVMLEDQAGFYARDLEFEFPLAGQTIGPVWEIDEQGSPKQIIKD